MPSYAVLGGTGGVGSALVALLSQRPDVVLHVYARSAKRLLKANPFLASDKSPHKVFEGQLTDTNVLAEAISGTTAVFGAIGTNSNNPHNHIAEDLAKGISAALAQLRSRDPNFSPPRVAFITSAGMTRDPRIRAQFSKFLHGMLGVVGKFIYEDFRQAMLVFEQPSNTWIPVIYIGAPGLMPGKSMGKVEIGDDIFAKAPLYVTYTDFADGLLQAIEAGDKWVGHELGVKGAKMPPIKYGLMMSLFITGVMAVKTPRLWNAGYRRGWWGH